MRRQSSAVGVALQAAKIGPQVGRMLIPQLAIFLQRLANCRFQPGRYLGIQLRRRRRIVPQNGAANLARTGAIERHLAGRHLVEHRSERKQIRARVDIFCPHLFRRHVCDGAQHCARTGEMLRSDSATRVSSSPAAGLAVTLAKPKSRILAWPRRVTKMLAGLMSR